MAKKAKYLQQRYYQETAHAYDSMHLRRGDEHYFSLHLLIGLIELYKIQSILDVGAGTGRVAQFLKTKYPELKIISVEPVKALREVGHEKGLTRNELMDGDATHLDFENESFDLVCAFGVFHHLGKPKIALSEMKRVSKKYLFISDSNNFGTGSPFSRKIKQSLNTLHLWNLVVFVKSKGRMYQVSVGDGLFYSFSIMKMIRLLKNYSVYPFATSPSKGNLYRDSTHVALFAEKLR